MVQAMEIFMITQQDVTKLRETEKLELGNVNSEQCMQGYKADDFKIHLLPSYAKEKKWMHV